MFASFATIPWHHPDTLTTEKEDSVNSDINSPPECKTVYTPGLLFNLFELN